MKVYNTLVLSMDTGEVLLEDSFEHNGPVCECKGGSSSTNTVDYNYNSRMAAIAERQEGMAEEYFSYWKDTQKPLETEQAQATRELLPGQTALTKAQIASQTSLLPTQTNVAKSYYDKVLGGVNVGEETGKAVADVHQATKGMAGERRREFSRMGLDISSPAYASVRSSDLRNKAAMMAGAKTKARRYADETQMERLRAAAGTL